MKKRNSPNKKKQIAADPQLSARFLAYEALQDKSLKSLPTDRIRELADRYDIAPRDRAFGNDLLAGSIKRRASIDRVIEIMGGRKPREIDSEILTLLRLGIYQLLFEDSVPDYAAVTTTCELAKHHLARQQVGFINAILRNVQRAIAGRQINITRENRAFVIPTGPEVGVQFSREVFPDKTDADYFAAAYSYPKWLVARWLSKWDVSTVKNILAAGNARPSVTCRPNPVKLGPEPAKRLAEILTAEGCRVRVLRDVEFVELLEHPPLTELPSFREGLFQIQDPTPAEAVKNMTLREDNRILDLCAGLGTKTTQLAEIAGGKSEIYASDRIESKLDKMKRNAQRLGLSNIKTLTIDELADDRFIHFFDSILLDVPCSNSGVFDRRPEARWRVKESDFAEYSRQSLEILSKADRVVKPDGQIVFTTCSIDDEENTQTMSAFCAQSAWEVVREHLQLPLIDETTNKIIRTGGYWASLRQSR